MPSPLALGVLLCWAPAALVLGWAIGPRRAALVALLGGYLFLPREVRWEALGLLTVDKRSVPGVSALLVVLAFDRKALLGLRPSWVDLPVLALVLAQPAGSLARGLAGMAGSVDQSWINMAGWAIPYAIGRLYFGEVDGPRRVALAIAVGGLAYAPACWFESVLGPRWYLSGLLYGTRPIEGMVDRLGGHRPEVFLGNGIEVAAWMATATVAASWLALSRSARGGPSGPPAWAAGASAVALGMTTLACRGVYGYALLAVGLAATAITLGLRTRLALMALFLVPPVYMVARSSGAWDGRELRAMARLGGRESTVGVRLEAESRVLREAPANGLAFGLGGRSPDWSVDGWWADSLRCGGVFGLVALYSAALVPAGLVIFGPPRRFPARSAESGLALLVVLHMLDGLHNTSLIASTPLIGGSLSGAWLAGRGPGAPDARRPGPEAPARRTSALALMATLIVLAAIEALGHATRTPWARPGPPSPVTRPEDPGPTNGPPPR